MTSYVEHLNQLLQRAIARHPRFVAFGQNIAAGSCLSGLSRNLPADPRHLVLNTPNAENALTGVGFGLMLKGVPAAFLMKQLDFLLLGVDQLVNTWNVLRLRPVDGSFTIVAIVVDGGFAGPQSSFNSLAALCGLTGVDGFTVTNAVDADVLFERRFGAPGLRIIAVSERMFRQPVIAPADGPPEIHDDGALIGYRKGAAATLVCANFSLPIGVELADALKRQGREVSLYSLNAAHAVDYAPVLADLQRTRRLVLLDDGKSACPPYAGLLTAAREICAADAVQVLARGSGSLRPNHERFTVSEADLSDLFAPAAQTTAIAAGVSFGWPRGANPLHYAATRRQYPRMGPQARRGAATRRR